MARQSIATTGRRRLLVGALGVALASATCATVLLVGNPTGGKKADQPSVVPHLVPDVGGLHSGSHGTTSAPQATDHPGIRLIPSAGGPVRVYGGVPSGPTYLPVQKKG